MEKYYLTNNHDPEYNLIFSLIESHIRLSSKRNKKYCSIPIELLGVHLYDFEQNFIRMGFKVIINSMFFIVYW